MRTLALVPVLLCLAAGAAGAAEQTPRELVYVSGSGKGARLSVIRDDGTGKRRLTKSASSESQAAYSRDGKRIAFVSIRGMNEDVYVVNADGSGLRRVTRGSTPLWRP